MNFLFHDYHQKTKASSSRSENNLLNDDETVKVYERFPVIILPKEGRENSSELQTIKGLTLGQLSEICNFSNSKIVTNNRELSSSEIYLLLADNEGDQDAKLFHYRYDIHGLETFYGVDARECLLGLPKKNSVASNNEKIFLIFITSTFERNVKYFGEIGYRYSLLETGSTVQTVKSNCANLKLTSHLLEANDEHLFEEILGIDGTTESLTAIVSIFKI